MKKTFTKLKEDCLKSNLELKNQGLIIYTFGNVSIVDRKHEVFAIKPSGVPYEELKSEDMVIVDFDNNVLEGELRPSSDTKTHAFLYKNWGGIGAVAHTHSTYAVSWSQANRPIPIFGTTHADHLTRDIPCTLPMDDSLIEGDYEHNTGVQIVNHFSQHGLSPDEINMILVANHGPFTWGKTGEKAVYNSKVLEELAKMACLTLQINPEAKLLKDALINKHYQRKHGKGAYYGQE